jgi:putative tricarboxylic transport membrane protein
MAWGERIFTALVGCIGAVWVWQSLSLNYWGEFAPGSGFLPFWLGLVLLVLVALSISNSFWGSEPAAVEQAAIGQPNRAAAIAIGFIACIAVLELLGFLIAVTLYLGFLIGIVERRSAAETLLVPPLTSIGLWLIFKHWLKIPLPEAPIGF